MKNIYSIISLFLLLFSISVFGQSKIYAPNLTAPENLEVEQMPDALLDWDAVTGGSVEISYEVQIATNPEFTDAVTFPRTAVTAETMSYLQFGGTYYWRVRAFDDDVASDWSVVWSFTVVWTVTMDKPNEGDEEYVNPEISWDEVTGISSYQMQVDTVNVFNSPDLKTFDIPSDNDSWLLSDLFFGQTYYYHLRAIHDVDTSLWSGIKSFITYASPELDSPSNGSETDLLVEFEWDEYEGITNYIFEIDTDENFGQPRTFAPEVDTLVVNDFVFGEEYFWRVAAQHAVDISDWSEVWNIQTVNTIILENPENEAVDITTCPVYTWIEVEGVSEYEFWIDIDETFSNPEMFTVDVPTMQCQSPLDKNTSYYWKVRGIAGADLSEWSETWSFTTEGAIGIDEQFNSDAVIIYPNPGNGEFNLYINSFGADNYLIKVVDISGKLIYETEVNCQAGSNYIPITLDNVDKGTYNLIISNKEKVVTKRLIIQ